MKNPIASIRLSLVLVGITLLGLALFVSYPPSASALGLVGGQPLFPWRLHTMITYSLLPGNVTAWLLCSVSLLCSGLIAERAFTPWLFALLIATSSILGGSVFLLITEHAGGSGS